MATYDSIKFNIDRARQVILEECDKVMRNAIEKHFGSLEYAGHLSEISSNGTTSYDYEVIFEDIRAWVMFFGMGQEMEDSDKNPYLYEYYDSEFWTVGRPQYGSGRGTVVKRGAGPYSQYDYRSGNLKHYDSGAEPQGEPLKNWQQKMFNIKSTEDFWDTIEKIHNSFLEGFNSDALPNIERRFVTECFTIEQHKI